MNVYGLFSGIGGYELGLQRAGHNIVGLCEIEPHCIRVLNKNFDVSVHEDIKTLKIEEGQCDILCGGFPCQDISVAGKNKGLLGGEKSSLWREYHRVIKESKPKYAIIENVSAILGRGLEIVLQDLAEIGYDATWTTFDSKYFGVPQRRRRVYILAVRDGIAADADIFKFNERNTEGHRSKVDAIGKSFEWDFTESGEEGEGFAFFTRQSNSEYACAGVSSALMKRDYKQFTDLVLEHDGSLRRVIPEERLLLQDYPVDWLDDCELTNSQKFSCNGMTVPVTEHIGRSITEYETTLSV